MKPINVAVLFGGKSSEHDISCISAATIVRGLDPDKYAVYPIFIDREGRWHYYLGDMQAFSEEKGMNEKLGMLTPAGNEKAALVVDMALVAIIDVVIPVFHGLGGEDGTIQGFLDILDVPYVGCGVRTSAICMDKLSTKLVVEKLGIRQAKYVAVTEPGFQFEAVRAEVEAKLGYPVFVKPSNAGSSIGVSCAHNAEELETALSVAGNEDYRILIEEAIVGRELECAVLGNFEVRAVGPGEILAADSFYTFDAKYTNAESKTVVRPELPEGKGEELRENAERIFRAVDGRGLSRVDFFLEKGTNQVVFNEINTFPGFTSISMYPMLWAAEGLEITALVDRLVGLAFEKSKNNK